VLALLMALAFLNYLDRNLLFPLQPLIRSSLGINETAMGALTTGFFVVYAITAPLSGYVADRVPRKTVLLFAVISWSLITATSGLAIGFTSLLVLRALTGLGEGGYFPSALSLLGDYFDARERGLAIALHGIATALGGAAGYAVGGVLGEHLGWRIPFFLAIIPGLALAFALSRLDEPPRPPRERTQATPLAAYFRMVSAMPVLLMSLAACAASFAVNGLNTWLPTYLHDERKISVASSGILTGAFFAAAALGQLAGGVFSDRLASRIRGARSALVALAYLGACPLAVAITRLDDIVFVLVAYGGTQFARGFAEPNIYGTILDHVAPTDRAAAQGFLLALTFAGSSLGPPLAGALFEAHRPVAAIDMLAAGAAISGVLAIALAVWLRATQRSEAS